MTRRDGEVYHWGEDKGHEQPVSGEVPAWVRNAAPDGGGQRYLQRPATGARRGEEQLPQGKAADLTTRRRSRQVQG